MAVVAGALLGELDLAPSWPAHGWLLTLALTSQVLGWLLIAIALPRLPASLTSVVLTVQPVGSVLLGIVLLGEDPAPLQLAGVAVIVAGIVVATRRTAPPPHGKRPRDRSSGAQQNASGRLGVCE